jgi:hypothetical protein
MPIGMTQADTIGMARKFASTPLGGEPVEVKGRVWRGGEAGEQRREDHARDFAHAPKRGAGAERGIGAGAHPRQPAFVARDQRQCRRERHLEARVHDCFRREQQHQERCDRHRAQGQDRPIEHDADEHDRDHDERPLGRHLRAGQDEIKRGDDESSEGRPLLDRRAVGQPGNERKDRAHDKEHDAGDHRHVVAGDRQYVADAGTEHCVVDRRRDRVALAGDESGGDRAGIAAEHRADAQIDGVAQPLNVGADSEPRARRRGRGHDLDRAAREAGGADALEIKVAGEIVAAGTQRRQRRFELRLDLDERAGRRRHAAAHGQPHALRRLGNAAAVDVLDAHDEAIGFLALLAQGHEA